MKKKLSKKALAGVVFGLSALGVWGILFFGNKIYEKKIEKCKSLRLGMTLVEVEKILGKVEKIESVQKFSGDEHQVIRVFPKSYEILQGLRAQPMYIDINKAENRAETIVCDEKYFLK